MEIGHSTIQGKDPGGWSYHASFDLIIRKKGSDKIVYKGILNAPLVENGPRSGQYCVVKALKTKPAYNQYDLECYVSASRKCAELLEMYNEMLGSDGKQIFCAMPWITLMDTVSDFQNLYTLYTRCFSRSKKARMLDPNEYVLVEPFIGGNFERLKSGSADWRTGSQGKELAAFCHFSWCVTSGDLAISSFNGVQRKDNYIITDPIIHSKSERYGPLDQSNYGIADFFRSHVCNKLCENWAKPTGMFTGMKDCSLFSLTFSNPNDDARRSLQIMRENSTL